MNDYLHGLIVLLRKQIYCRRNNNSRGASLVEMAFALPFLLAFLLGIVEFSRILIVRSSLRTATLKTASLGAVIPDLEKENTAILGEASRRAVLEQLREEAKMFSLNTFLSDVTTPSMAQLTDIDQSALMVTHPTSYPAGLSKMHPVQILLPEPAAGETLEQAMLVRPVEVKIRAKVKSIIPLIPPIDINLQTAFYREAKIYESQPVALNCLGNPLRVGEIVECPCVPSEGHAQQDGVDLDRQKVTENGECTCRGDLKGDDCVCPDGFVEGDTYQCVCNKRCEPYQVLDSSQCVCHDVICPAGQKPGTNGQCICDALSLKCQADEIAVSDGFGGCKCQKCENLKIPDSTGLPICVCSVTPNPCDPTKDEYLDVNECKCKTCEGSRLKPNVTVTGCMCEFDVSKWDDISPADAASQTSCSGVRKPPDCSCATCGGGSIPNNIPATSSTLVGDGSKCICTNNTSWNDSGTQCACDITPQECLSQTPPAILVVSDAASGTTGAASCLCKACSEPYTAGDNGSACVCKEENKNTNYCTSQGKQWVNTPISGQNCYSCASCSVGKAVPTNSVTNTCECFPTIDSIKSACYASSKIYTSSSTSSQPCGTCLSCNAGQVFDPNLKTCACSPTVDSIKSSCYANSQSYSSTSSLPCGYCASCPSGKTFNGGTKTCDCSPTVDNIKSSCYANSQSYSSNTSQPCGYCASCSSSKSFDTITKTCTCSSAAAQIQSNCNATGQIYNSSSTASQPCGACAACSTGKVLTPGTNTCECSPTVDSIKSSCYANSQSYSSTSSLPCGYCTACPFGKVLNPGSNTCECSPTVDSIKSSCYANSMTYSSSTSQPCGSCAACPFSKSFDTITKTCTCSSAAAQIQSSCNADGNVYTSSSTASQPCGACIPCPAGKSLTPGTNTCECSPAIDSIKSSCYANSQSYSSTSSLPCGYCTSCPSGQSLDPVSHTCKCTINDFDTCPRDGSHYIDLTSCQCKSCNPSLLNYEGESNVGSCACVVPYAECSAQNKITTTDGTCNCLDCANGTVFSGDKCCPLGHRVITLGGACACDYEELKSDCALVGKEPDNSTCSCTSCASPKVWDSDSAKCVCGYDNLKSMCGAGALLNMSTCICGFCSDGRVADETGLGCLCANTCTDGYVIDITGGKCECVPACADGLVRQGDICCEEGYINIFGHCGREDECGGSSVQNCMVVDGENRWEPVKIE